MIKLKTLAAMAFIALTATNAVALCAPADNLVQTIVEQSEGNVTIDIPESVMKLLFPPAVVHKAAKGVVLHSGVNHMKGWRVQVFSQTDNPASLEARARARASMVGARFPKYHGQIYSGARKGAPGWYTQVGNFINQAEANAALAELKRAFPKYASEMRVIPCQITIIK